MTKADSKKNLFYSMFVRNIYIAVVYVLALNFFVKSVLFVPCLPRGFVLGTRFKFYVLNIFFWGGGGGGQRGLESLVVSRSLNFI